MNSNNHCIVFNNQIFIQGRIKNSGGGGSNLDWANVFFFVSPTPWLKKPQFFTPLSPSFSLYVVICNFGLVILSILFCKLFNFLPSIFETQQISSPFSKDWSKHSFILDGNSEVEDQSLLCDLLKAFD